MESNADRSVIQRFWPVAMALPMLWAAMGLAQTPAAQTAPAASTAAVPDWALPGSSTHKQVAPPKDFHRDSVTFNTPLGIFEGVTDVGAPLVPGASSYDPATKAYTVTSAGYNIWYQRDEFRYVWKKMSGDVSLASDVTFLKPMPLTDRKVVLVIRQNLEDDSKEVMIAEHSTGMIHLAQRPDKGADLTDMTYTFGGSLARVRAGRIGIEKRGDSEAIFISIKGEGLHQFGPPAQVHFDEPFYVGIGFCSHEPVTTDTGIFSNVVLENAAGRVR